MTSETVVNTCDLLLAPMTHFYPDLNSRLDPERTGRTTGPLLFSVFWDSGQKGSDVILECRGASDQLCCKRGYPPGWPYARVSPTSGRRLASCFPPQMPQHHIWTAHSLWSFKCPVTISDTLGMVKKKSTRPHVPGQRMPGRHTHIHTGREREREGE